MACLSANSFSHLIKRYISENIPVATAQWSHTCLVISLELHKNCMNSAWIYPHATLTLATGKQLPQWYADRMQVQAFYPDFTHAFIRCFDPKWLRCFFSESIPDLGIASVIFYSLSYWRKVPKRRSSSDHLIFWECEKKCLSWYWELLISGVF